MSTDEDEKPRQDGQIVVPGSYKTKCSSAWKYAEVHGLCRTLLFEDLDHAYAVHAALDSHSSAKRKWNARRVIATAEGVDNPWSGNAVWLTTAEMKELIDGTIPAVVVERVRRAHEERDQEYEDLFGRAHKATLEGDRVMSDKDVDDVLLRHDFEGLGKKGDLVPKSIFIDFFHQNLNTVERLLETKKK